MRIREKGHRLQEAAYRGRKAVTFTVCTQRRMRGLADPAVHDAFVPIMGRSCEGTDSMVSLYCLMPDHAHVIFSGMSDVAAPKRAMETFKHLSGMWLAEHRPHLRWQKDFHDRILRRKEIAATCRYIALNPVRAGLAEDIHGWPFTGSVGFELGEVLLDAFWE
jgi:REP element-mobilizing transposase RayT